MNTQDALDFLRAHQPLMPNEVDDRAFSRFDEVRKHFATHPDDRCLPLLIGALGPGDGHGTYVMIEDLLRLYPRDAVIDVLRNGLKSPHLSVRYWSAQFSANYPDSNLQEELIEAFLLGDADTQVAVVTALEAIAPSDARKRLPEIRERSRDDEVRALIDEVIGA